MGSNANLSSFYSSKNNNSKSSTNNLTGKSIKKSNSTECNLTESDTASNASIVSSASSRLNSNDLKKKTNFHEFELDDEKYDEIKQQFLDLALPTEFKVLGEAQNNIGSWQSINTTTIKPQNSTNKALTRSNLISLNTSTNNSCNYYRNFNDWRSHLIYYKQIKGYNNNLPDFLKDLNSLKSSSSTTKFDDFRSINKKDISKSIVPNLINIKEETILFNSIIKSQLLAANNAVNAVNNVNNSNNSKQAGNENNVQNLKINPTHLLNILNRNSNTSGSNINKKTVNGPHRTNIDFKMENQRRNNEPPSAHQKCIPYLKGTRTGGGVMRVSPKIEKSNYQLSSNILTTLLTNNSNSVPGITSVLTTNGMPHEENSSYYTITSLDTATNSSVNSECKARNSNSKKSEKRIIAFYHRVNKNEYTGSSKGTNQATTSANSTPDQTSKALKQSKQEKIVDKYQIGQPSLTNFIASSNLMHSTNKLRNSTNSNNFQKLTSRLQKQHEQLIMQHQDQTDQDKLRLKKRGQSSGKLNENMKQSLKDQSSPNANIDENKLLTFRVKFEVAN